MNVMKSRSRTENTCFLHPLKDHLGPEVLPSARYRPFRFPSPPAPLTPFPQHKTLTPGTSLDSS